MKKQEPYTAQNQTINDQDTDQQQKAGKNWRDFLIGTTSRLVAGVLTAVLVTMLEDDLA